MTSFLTICSNIFDRLANFWRSKKAKRLFSNLMVVSFVAMLSVALLNHFKLLTAFPFLSGVNFFTAIHFSLTILLLVEMTALLFVIPQSIAKSIAKQFEILCLILLRSAFKEFSGLDLSVAGSLLQEPVLKMLADGFSALIVFFLLGFYYKVQKHRSITSASEDLVEFVLLKKNIAFCMLLFMFGFGIADTYHFFHTGIFTQSFSDFYLILILGDLLLMLIAFRFVIHFPDVFRYSSFILITIFIRLSLTAPVYYNGLLAIITALFAIGIAYTHNWFLESRNKTIASRKIADE